MAFDIIFLNFTGVPLEVDDLTTQYGGVDFEDFGLYTTDQTPDSTEQVPIDFDMEMKKVTSLLRKTGFEMPEQEAKEMLDDLMTKAKGISNTDDERREKVEMVDSLVRMFMRSNAERARKQQQMVRMPKTNPVEEQNKRVRENLAEQSAKLTNNDNAMAEPEDYEEDFTHVLFSKVNAHSGPRDHFEHLLNPPTTIRPKLFTTMGPNFEPLQGIPENSLSKPSLFKDSDVSLPSIPRSTTQGNPDTQTERFTEILRETASKDQMEDNIMDMIIEDPVTVVEVLSNMFDHETEKEKSEQKQELEKLIDKDPLGVTVAFSDLVMKQKEIMKSKPENVGLPPMPIEKENKEGSGRLTLENLPKIKNIIRMKRPKEVLTKPEVDSITEAPKMSGQVLGEMLTLLDEGELSHEDIIEEMINKGLLPVEVTEFGKIPISVGVESNRAKSKPLRFRPRRPSKPITFPPKKEEKKKIMKLKPIKLASKTRMKIPTLKPFSADFFEDSVETNPNPKPGKPSLPLRIKPVTTTVENSKEIEVTEPIMKLYENGLISRLELVEMMSLLGREGDIPNIPVGLAEKEVRTSVPKSPQYASSYSYGGIKHVFTERPILAPSPEPEQFRFPQIQTKPVTFPKPIPKKRPVSQSYVKISMPGPSKENVEQETSAEHPEPTMPPMPPPILPPASTYPPTIAPTAAPIYHRYPPPTDRPLKSNSYVAISMGTRKPPTIPTNRYPPTPYDFGQELLNTRPKNIPSVHEFSQAMTSEELKDSFQDIFENFDTSDYTFGPTPLEEYFGNYEEVKLDQVDPHFNTESPNLVPELAKLLSPSKGNLDESFISDFIHKPPKHPFHGTHVTSMEATQPPPTVAPHKAPTMAPHRAPTLAPHRAPTFAPHRAPTRAPTVAPNIDDSFIGDFLKELSNHPFNKSPMQPTQAPTQPPLTPSPQTPKSIISHLIDIPPKNLPHQDVIQIPYQSPFPYRFQPFMPHRLPESVYHTEHPLEPLPDDIFSFDEMTHNVFKPQAPKPPFAPPEGLMIRSTPYYPAIPAHLRRSDNGPVVVEEVATLKGGQRMPKQAGLPFPYSSPAFTGHVGIDSNLEKIRRSFLLNEKMSLVKEK